MDTAMDMGMSTTRGILCLGECEGGDVGLYDLVGWWKDREESRERKSIFEVEDAEE